MLSLARIIRSGWQKFVRERSASSAALVVMVVVLFLVSSLFFLRGMSDFMIESLQDRVDISTYFQESATEDEILQLRDEVARLPEVREVEYVSREEALDRFRARHEGDEVILRSLDVIGGNPLLASLNIKTWDLDAFGRISLFLENSASASIIDNVDYSNRRPVIERVSQISSGTQAGILFASVILGFIAVLVAFNTIRLTIYSSREEIEVMRLVGASNWFTQGPFLIAGLLAGSVSVILAQLILLPVAYFFSPTVEAFTEGFSLWGYYAANILTILLFQLAVAVSLGVFSSVIAIRKYLTV